jgi:hypothetical protein
MIVLEALRDIYLSEHGFAALNITISEVGDLCEAICSEIRPNP